MKIIKCGKGHFYDADYYGQCPHCENEPFFGNAETVYSTPEGMYSKKKISLYTPEGIEEIKNPKGDRPFSAFDRGRDENKYDEDRYDEDYYPLNGEATLPAYIDGNEEITLPAHPDAAADRGHSSPAESHGAAPDYPAPDYAAPDDKAADPPKGKLTFSSSFRNPNSFRGRFEPKDEGEAPEEAASYDKMPDAFHTARLDRSLDPDNIEIPDDGEEEDLIFEEFDDSVPLYDDEVIPVGDEEYEEDELVSSEINASIADDSEQNHDRILTAGWLVCIAGSARGESISLYPGVNTISPSEKGLRFDNKKDKGTDDDAALVYDAVSGQYTIDTARSELKIYVNDALAARPTVIKDRDHISFGSFEYIFVPFCNDQFRWEDR